MILVLLLGLVSGVLIVAIAWTHKPISVWEMIKEELRLRRKGKTDENHYL